MGIQPLASQGVVETKSRLTGEVKWAKVRRLLVITNKIGVKHIGGQESRFRNETGGDLTWRAVFAGE